MAMSMSIAGENKPGGHVGMGLHVPYNHVTERLKKPNTPSLHTLIA